MATTAAAPPLYYDPVSRALVPAEAYATGPSHGHPCWTLDEALAKLQGAFREQLAANEGRVADLLALKHAVQEMASISLLREQEAVAKVHDDTAMMVAQLHRHEEGLVASLKTEGDSQRQALARTLESIEAMSSNLLSATAVLQSTEEQKRPPSEAARGDDDNDKDKTAAEAKKPSASPSSSSSHSTTELLQALCDSEQLVLASCYYDVKVPSILKVVNNPQLQTLAAHHAASSSGSPSSPRGTTGGATTTPLFDPSAYIAIDRTDGVPTTVPPQLTNRHAQQLSARVAQHGLGHHAAAVAAMHHHHGGSNENNDHTNGGAGGMRAPDYKALAFPRKVVVRSVSSPKEQQQRNAAPSSPGGSAAASNATTVVAVAPKEPVSLPLYPGIIQCLGTGGGVHCKDVPEDDNHYGIGIGGEPYRNPCLPGTGGGANDAAQPSSSSHSTLLLPPIVRVFGSVPLLDGPASNVGQAALFRRTTANTADESAAAVASPSNNNNKTKTRSLVGGASAAAQHSDPHGQPPTSNLSLAFCRTVSCPGAVIWWDFGEGVGVDVSSYTLVHGHQDPHCALRSWRVLGTNASPPCFGGGGGGTSGTAGGGSAGGSWKDKAADGFLLDVAAWARSDADWAVLDERCKDSSLGRPGGPPHNAVHFECLSAARAAVAHSKPSEERAQKFFRFIGVQSTGPNAAGDRLLHVELSGAEFYGTLKIE